MYLVEEYDLALNVSQIDNSETPNNNSQDDMLVLKSLPVKYPNKYNCKSFKYKLNS